MKNRNIPYGYCYENGTVVTKKTETEVLKKIFTQYLQGASLLDIAKDLNREEIEYLPGVVGWNKSRLMRIIDDKRYLGNDTFPAIIDQAEYERMHELKAMKNTQRGTDRNSEIFHLKIPVKCASCGNIMRRRHDNRVQEQCRWMCTNPDCKLIICIQDEIFLRQITEKINAVINDPKIIEIPKPLIKSKETTIRMNLEIERMLASGQFHKSLLKKKITECAAQKYMEIGNGYYVASRLKADLENTSPLSTFSESVSNKVLQSILLQPDKTIKIVLINGQQI